MQIRRGLLMSTDSREARLERRIADLYASDEQFAAAKPDEVVSAAAVQPGLRLPDVVRTVMEGYAERPALGQRAVEYVTDATGRTTAQRCRGSTPSVTAACGSASRPSVPPCATSRSGPATAWPSLASPASTTPSSTSP